MQQQVGRYQILSQLGKGAMGVVYLANDPLLNRQVAIKTIDLTIEDAARREFLRGRLLRDARAAASLSHANIVGIYDVVEDGDFACIVMEYVNGENLAAYLSRNPIADPQYSVYVIRAMAAALDYTHKRGIIHRDIKPANVMLDTARTPKITDFGIARITECATTNMTGTVMGTIEYMAPEQIKGEAIDGRADQFALGVVAYRMLTGSTLYGEGSMATIAYKIVNETPAPARSRNSWLPYGIDSVLDKALAKDPNDRYANCSEFGDALAVAMTGVDREASTVAMTMPTGNETHGNRGRNRRLVVIAAGATAAIAGLSIAKPWETWTHTTPVETRPTLQAAAPPVENPAPKKALVKPPAKTSTAAAAQAATVEQPADADVESQIPLPSGDPASDAINHGRELMKGRQFAEAVQAFTKAADIRPRWVQAYIGRGNAYQKLEQFDAAIRDYSRAIRIDPKSFQAYFLRGQSYVRSEQDDLALADFTQAIALKPAAPAALTARGEIYLRKKDYPKAVADFSDTIRITPDNGAAYRGRAAARRALGDRAGAQADREKARGIAEKKGG
jgi:tetratricopeptide (TPR) repeat protein/predicted Ser/Thr protein kinase